MENRSLAHAICGLKHRGLAMFLLSASTVSNETRCFANDLKQGLSIAVQHTLPDLLLVRL